MPVCSRAAWLAPAGDGAGRVDDAAVRAAERHLPHQQRRVHHRGGDPRRPVQRDQELGGRDYTGLVDDAIHNSDGSCWTNKVRTEGELKEAIARMTRARSSSSGAPGSRLPTAGRRTRSDPLTVLRLIAALKCPSYFQPLHLPVCFKQAFVF